MSQKLLTATRWQLARFSRALRACETDQACSARGSVDGQAVAVQTAQPSTSQQLHTAYAAAAVQRANTDQNQQRQLGPLLWGLAAAGALGYLGVQQGRASDERLNPETLSELARDLMHGQYADKERAVAMLSSLTLYIDYHDALLRTNVLPALMSAASNRRVEPTVRVVALGCVADLFKHKEAHRLLAEDPDFLATVMHCLNGEDGWDSGPEEGGLAKSHAARLLAELAGNAQLHPLLLRSGAAAAIAARGAELAQHSEKQDKTYSSLQAVPGTSLELQAVNEERYAAAAMFGLAGSQEGQHVISHNEAALRAGLFWAESRDPILQRYGVGTVARIATSDSAGLADVAAVGGLKTLVVALNQDDPQAQCYASAAVGKLAMHPKAAMELVRLGAAQALLNMLQDVASPTDRKESRQHQKEVGATSKGVRMGVYRCALKAIRTVSSSPQFKQALQQAQAPAVIQALMGRCNPEADRDLVALAKEALQTIQQ